jgi:ankyrin repeat protein
VNASDYDKRSASHLAAAEGNVAAMKVLVEFGADLTLHDRWKNTIDDEANRSKSGPLLAYLESLRNLPKTKMQDE